MSYRGIWNNGIDGDRSALAQAAAVPPLSRQPSIYSLTFDEFQSTIGGIGKDLGSMNMDEFLKNLWTAEESQAMAAALGGLDGGAGALQRQGSFSFPRTLSTISQKTVDEVWRNVITDNVESVGESDLHKQQRQSTLGEMTLEEFLVRAGAVREENYKYKSNNSGVYNGGLSASGNNNSALAFSFPQVESSNAGVMPNSIPGNSDTDLAISVAGATPYAAQQPLGDNVDLRKQQGMRGGVAGVVDQTISNGLITGMVGFGAGTVAVALAGSLAKQVNSDRLGKGNRELSSLPPVPYALNGALRGRKSDGALEKVFERRQRRMIKNRESAARSRARKQVNIYCSAFFLIDITLKR